MRRWIAAFFVLVVAAGAAVYFIFVYQPAIDPIAPADVGKFDASLIAEGSHLAAIGDCAACHTRPDGPALAGGVPVPTPFGTIFSSNITPDLETGIGTWSEAAFVRAMRHGISRTGRHLYPAFPYDHFTHVTDADNHALYAYLMTRDPAKSEPPRNRLAFPFNFRAIVAGWNLLYLRGGSVADDPGQSPEWNRGRYLVEGLGHCGACHTPRNSLSAEDSTRAYAGGPVIDGWYVYPINAGSPAPVKWDAASLVTYLRAGFSADHGIARGPMAQVTAKLAEANDADVHAIAVYVSSLMGNAPGEPAVSANPPSAPPLQSGDSLAPPPVVSASVDRGALIFATACAGCHESGRLPPFGGIDFHKSTAVNADSPQNIVNMVLFGLPAAEGRTGGIMPGFAGSLSADDVVSLLGYLRSSFTDKPAWTMAATVVADTVSGKTVVRLYGSDGVERGSAPVNPPGNTR